MNRQETLDYIVKTIVEKINPHRIYLFGSQARGDATEESDFDIVVVADMEGPRHHRGVAVSQLFPLRDFSLDVFVFKPEEFEKQKGYISSVSYLACNEGRILYDRMQ
jgi:predicted nucleotidyltransferase